MNNEKNIILTADDFGISPQADKNILELTRKNKLDRVEIMMSKNITPEQVKELLSSGIKLDIHLHLIENKIDRWQKGIEPHIIKHGIVKRGVLFFWSLFFGSGAPQKAAMEWDKQIEDFIKVFGRQPDGISSHEHRHYFTPYLKETIKLAQRFSIPYVRFGTDPLKKNPTLVSLVISFLKKRNANLFSSSKLESTDLMISYDWIDKDFENYIKKLPQDKKTELVFHPEIESEMKKLEEM